VDDLTKEVNSLRQSNDEMAMKYGEQQVNDPLQREMLRASSTSFLGDENHRRVQLEEERAAIKERERELERTFHEESEKGTIDKQREISGNPNVDILVSDGLCWFISLDGVLIIYHLFVFIATTVSRSAVKRQAENEVRIAERKLRSVVCL
jgi:hypothetical protein